MGTLYHRSRVLDARTPLESADTLKSVDTAERLLCDEVFVASTIAFRGAICESCGSGGEEARLSSSASRPKARVLGICVRNVCVEHCPHDLCQAYKLYWHNLLQPPLDDLDLVDAVFVGGVVHSICVVEYAVAESAEALENILIVSWVPVLASILRGLMERVNHVFKLAGRERPILLRYRGPMLEADTNALESRCQSAMDGTRRLGLKVLLEAFAWTVNHDNICSRSTVV